YLDLTQKGEVPRLQAPQRQSEGTSLEIDPATRRSLELTEASGGGRTGSLLHLIDETLTGPGARLMAQRLAAPLTDHTGIARRLDAVRFFLEKPETRERLRGLFARIPDIERALSRLSVGRGGPRDLGAIARGLQQGTLLCEILALSG